MFPLLRRAPVFLLAACALVGAAPHVDIESQSDKRGLGLGLVGAAQTVETMNLEETPEGLVTTRCLVTLTPVIELGEELVVESKECVVTLANDGSSIIINGSNGSNNNNNNDNNNNNNNNGSSNTFTTATDTFTDTSTDISFTSTSLSSFTTSSVDSSANTFFSTPELSTSTELSTATASSSIETGTALGAQNTEPAVSTEALSSVPNTAAIASATAPPAVTTAAVSSIAVSAIQSGTAAAADNSPSASTTPFTLPGKKLQVLPIGLGVFAGISVIALIVVGLVTYERTKYRKAFRQRKLAEAGASMGYGGMSQRV